MKITRPLRGVVHLHFPSQREMCKTLVRIQEFYESPYPEIKGKFFTLEKFAALYCVDHGSPFSYYEDWHGFNFPGDVLREFARVFRGRLTADELFLLSTIEVLPDVRYLIGTHQPDDVTHEIAHAMFHIDKYYRTSVSTLVSRFTKFVPDAALALKRWLLHEGYCEAVLVDEFNAYLATNGIKDWQNDFSPKMADLLASASYPFVKEFKRNLKFMTETSVELQTCLDKIAREADRASPYTGTTSVISERKRGGKSRRTGTAKKPSKRGRASRKTAR